MDEFQPAFRLMDSPTATGYHFVFVEGRLLVPEDENLPLAAIASPGWIAQAAVRHYLGRLMGQDCWAMTLADVPANWRAIPLRAAMLSMPAAVMAVAARAAQVIEWDRAHRFCGVCGTPTEPKPDERARQCPACKHVAYPRISPAMMALVWREGEVLLARGPGFTPGIYSALAGFVEPGESLEQCVVREVREEVGVEVTDLQYYGSQSWPFPHSLMLAFTARWVSGEIVPQPGEIEEAAWYKLDALPGIPPRFSIAGHLIRDSIRKWQSSLR